MSTSLQVSVVVPTHNRPREIQLTLEPLRNQRMQPGDFEIVVVDDGSTPPLRLGDSPSGVAVTLLRTPGVGRSQARNLGAERAVGRVLVFVDDDMTVGGDFLAAHLDGQRDYGGVIATGAIRLPAEVLTTPFGRFRQALEESGVPTSRGLTDESSCAAGNMSIPRDLFHRLGGFSPTSASGEDQDLALRHTRTGGRTAFLPEASAIHRDGALDIAPYCARVEWGMRNIGPFSQAHPYLSSVRERERINGPLSPVGDPMSLTARKMLKSFLATAPVSRGMLALTRVCERLQFPDAVLYRIYALLIGIHVFRGYRAGRARR